MTRMTPSEAFVETMVAIVLVSLLGAVILAAAIATVLGAAFSLGIWMLQPRFAALLMGLALLPMVAPPVVSAQALLLVGMAKIRLPASPCAI